MNSVQERAALVDKLRKEGMPLAKALKEAKTAQQTYYKHRRKKKKVLKAKFAKALKEAKTSFVDLPIQPVQSGVVTLIVCAPNQISKVLKEIL